MLPDGRKLPLFFVGQEAFNLRTMPEIADLQRYRDGHDEVIPSEGAGFRPRLVY